MGDIAVRALDAYLNLLEQKGAAVEVVLFRRNILRRLVQILRGQPRNRDVYRSAINALLSICPPGDRPAAMTAAREYYYFWLGDLQRLAQMNARAGFTTHHVRLPVLASFADLQQRMSEENFASFPPSLDIYLGKLYELGADDEVLAERAGLIKPLLYLLHGQAHHPDSFRTAVDAMLIHLTDDYARDSFLTISREFFYYWMTFPDAGVRQKKATLA
ncbi:hypothetical protein [Vogesella indigofera]|uniref:hypothetical protein n=1 Tax=Vogesella indigofera TaxID=45465 RepID=UPI00234D883D|nr:hypothetical protein [Vogesella indigofera]MDC7704944.1 hypothetical protein [Vogesella indigofera]